MSKGVRLLSDSQSSGTSGDPIAAFFHRREDYLRLMIAPSGQAAGNYAVVLVLDEGYSPSDAYAELDSYRQQLRNAGLDVN